MILWLTAALAGPHPADTAETAARTRLSATGWESAIGEVTFSRVPHAPRPEGRLGQILADATLAWFSAGDRVVTLTDAAWEGPRWLGAADPEAEELVRTCPAKMMGSTALEDVVLHELGHAALLSTDLGQRFQNLKSWSALAGWEERAADESWQPADGLFGGMLQHESPEVAVRLCTGKPRGDDRYRLTRGDTVSLYARFDPIEDMAESFQRFHSDPDALLARSPVKYLALASPSAWGGTPGKTVLLEGDYHDAVAWLFHAAPLVALDVLREHGDTLAPQLQGLDRGPFSFKSAQPFDPALYQVTIDGKTYRPPDAFFHAHADEIEAEKKAIRDWEEVVEKLRTRSSETRDAD